KFVRPGAQRVSTSTSRSVLLATSFINEDNRIATIVMNETDNAINYDFIVDTQEVALSIPARSMQTLTY
ncbi:MAG: glycosyl hydrolase, partial [Gammaproteobacteria bacterium]|nr:glycosyl hydrolase [Gammaproteobacteria bacterium]